MGIFEDTSEKVVNVQSGNAAILDLPTIESEPAPSVMWHDEQGPLAYDHKYAVTASHQLVILATTKSDERAYR